MSFREWWEEYTRDIRTSSELINELIAITTEFDETIYNIGRETFNLFKKNQIFDVVTVDLCRRVEADVAHLEQYRKDMEDFESFVQGDIPAKGASAVTFKLKSGANQWLINRELNNFRRTMREHYEEIGRRVFSQGPSDGSITTNPRIRRMCVYGTHVKEDSEAKWAQIEERNKSMARGPGFNALAANFVVGFVRFANSTWIGNWMKSARSYQEQLRSKVRLAHKDKHWDNEGGSGGRMSSDTSRPPSYYTPTQVRRLEKSPEADTPAAAPTGQAPAAPGETGRLQGALDAVNARNAELKPGTLFGGGGTTGFGKAKPPQETPPPEASAITPPPRPVATPRPEPPAAPAKPEPAPAAAPVRPVIASRPEPVAEPVAPRPAPPPPPEPAPAPPPAVEVPAAPEPVTTAYPPQAGYPPQEYPQYPPQQYPPQQYPPQYPGYPPQGYPQGYPPPGYPQYPPQQYPPQQYPGYPPQGYPPQGYPQGYPPPGYPPQGYPQYPPPGYGPPPGQEYYPPPGYPPQQAPPGAPGYPAPPPPE